jgi:hypothetical protein
MKKTIALCAVLTAAGYAAAATATFDTKDTSPSGYYKPGTGGDQSWSDNGITFSMTEDLTYGYYWEGFAYSDVNDTVTSGSGNQYAVYGDGKDRSNNGVYTVGYTGFYGVPPAVSFASAVTVNGFYVNNTTYAALDMLNGSGFSKKFGGVSGNDEDWFKLTVQGFDAGSSNLGSVDFYLADYRFADNGQDYILNDWTFVDLNGLGDNVSSLQFSLSSSDNGGWGMNTPSYFAIDDMQAIPEPASVMLIMLGGLGITGYRRLRASYGIR